MRWPGAGRTVSSASSHGSRPLRSPAVDHPPRGDCRDGRTPHLVGGLGAAGRRLRGHPHGDGPRVRALHHGQTRRHEGDRLLRRLRAGALLDHRRRDPLRGAGHPRRGLRQGARYDLDGPDRARRGVAHLPVGQLPAQGPVRLRRLAHAPGDGPRARVGLAGLRRTAVGEPRRGLRLHVVAGPHGQRRAAGRNSPERPDREGRLHGRHQRRPAGEFRPPPRRAASDALRGAPRPVLDAARDAGRRADPQGRRIAARLGGPAGGIPRDLADRPDRAPVVARGRSPLVHRGRLVDRHGRARDGPRLLTGPVLEPHPPGRVAGRGRQPDESAEPARVDRGRRAHRGPEHLGRPGEPARDLHGGQHLRGDPQHGADAAPRRRLRGNRDLRAAPQPSRDALPRRREPPRPGRLRLHDRAAGALRLHPLPRHRPPDRQPLPRALGVLAPRGRMVGWTSPPVPSALVG